jgi:acetyl esterase/lipase
MTAVADDVLAETRAFNAELERQLAANPATNEMPVEVARRQRLEGGGVFPPPTFRPERARDVTIDGRAGPIGLRVIAPEQTAVGAYLHIHGGGWALSAANLQDPLLVELADTTGLCAVSVDYRLAPEHPHPAAPDDCEDAALWLLREGFDALGLPPVATIGGDSAGGHLSAVTLLRLRDRHAITGAFAAANLIYGAFDLSMTPSQRLWGERNLILSTPILHHFGDMFLPGRSDEERRDPDVSPLYAQLHDMPPALFTVGTMDPLLDDSLFMHARWSAAGARAELRTWPEAIHGFNAFPLRVTAAARAEQYAFLRAAVGAGG